MGGPSNVIRSVAWPRHKTGRSNAEIAMILRCFTEVIPWTLSSDTALRAILQWGENPKALGLPHACQPTHLHLHPGGQDNRGQRDEVRLLSLALSSTEPVRTPGGEGNPPAVHGR